MVTGLPGRAADRCDCRDAAHGYVLTLAAGGQLTELLQDSAALLMPADRAEIHAALTTTCASGPCSTAIAGKPPRDNIDAILDAVMAVQAYVVAASPPRSKLKSTR